MKKIFVKGKIFSIVCFFLFFVTFTNSQSVRDETLTIVANVTVKPEFRDEILKAIKTVVDASVKEPGCIFYDVYEDINNPVKFVFIETWKSKAAIDSHTKTTHFKDFIKSIEDKATLEASTLKQKF